MNKNQANNINDSKQQLSLKAYVLNKYEQLKNPQLQSESTILDSSKTILPFQQQNNYSINSSTNQALNHSYIVKTQQTLINTPMAAKRHFSGSNSSLQNSDDDDDDFGDNDTTGLNGSIKSREEKRRLSHTAAEQKRRNAIKQGYELLKARLPNCQQTDPYISMRITRATTLEQTIDYIHELEKEKDKHEQELDSLKKEIIALKIMKSNYEEILQYHRNMPKDNSVEINDEAKFDLFVKFADNLFQSFSSMICTNTFSELTSSTLNWLEQMCSSNNLKNLVLLSLFQVTQQILH